MTQSLRGDLAKRYLLEDLPGASQLGARLNGILLKIDSGEQVTALQRQFLIATGLHALCALSDGKITQGEFRPLAEQEQAARIEEASAKAVKDAAERAACEMPPCRHPLAELQQDGAEAACRKPLRGGRDRRQDHE
mgnify:CR=1 FL=1